MSRSIVVPIGFLLIALFLSPCGIGSVLAQDPAAPEAPAEPNAVPASPVIPTATVEEEEDPATLAAKASYILGFNTARKMVMDLSNQGIDVDQGQMLVGIQDALKGKNIAYSPDEIRTILMAFQRTLQKKQMEKMEKAAAENRETGDAFRKENAAKEGVKETESGIQYEILTAGEGENLDSSYTVLVDYTGKFTDGTVFDTSLKSKGGRPPAPLPMKVSGAGVIPAFKEILPMMKVGSKWRLVIPPEMAYQVRGQGPIGPNETLVFEIEIKEKVKTPESTPK
jgi:FKBP-type peptidyl-prolyl cis-trans isomerase